MSLLILFSVSTVAVLQSLLSPQKGLLGTHMETKLLLGD